MLPDLNSSDFLDALIDFVDQFIPSLDIHRLHIYRQTPSKLQLNIEMTFGQILWVVASHEHDHINLQLDYGSQRVELWMFAKTTLQSDSINEISMNGTLVQDIHKNHLQIRRNTSLFDDSLIRLASEMGLSLRELKHILLGALSDVRKESILILGGDVIENSYMTVPMLFKRAPSSKRCIQI